MPTFPSELENQIYLYQYTYGRRGLDLNVVNVWDDYTGRGVLVGVIDDGVDYNHYDLDNNYDKTRDYDIIGQDSDPLPVLANDNNGTAVAGIIAAEANGVGTVGVAYNAKIAGIRAVPGSLANVIDALSRAASFDVVNNGWSFQRFDDNFYTFPQAGQALTNAVTNGRNGLGTAIIFAAGDGRGAGDNTNYHNFQNSRHVITVAAIDLEYGWATYYSTPGASILVSAFGESYGGVGLLTTDRLGSAGYSSTDYTRLTGTSIAAPQVSGVVALILEANPNLGYRDIQEILAYSARRNDPNNYAGKYIWQYNGANNWNGRGLHVSHDYGFGLVDALAAVRLAETWQKQSRFNNEKSLSYNSGNLGLAIPDNNTTGISRSFTVAAGLEIDWVEVELNLTHPYRGDLVVELISPSGTISSLINRPGNKQDDGDNIIFKLSSTQHWGESSAGTWTLRIKDLGPTDTGIFNSWKLHLYGDTDTANDTYFYTNEYGIYGATTLTDSSGIDTINAAAITSNSTINLTPGSTSTLNGTKLTISSGTTIENAFGGDGNDTIIGNSAANVLSGGRGNDILIGDIPLTYQTYTFSNTSALNIPDESTINSNLTVSALSGAIADVNVTLNITQTYSSHLDVFLISPTGTRVTLFTGVGSIFSNFTSTVLDDEATTSITAGNAPFTGTFRPQGLLSAFDYQNPNGTWRLEVTDKYVGGVGTLKNWSLNLSFPATSTVSNDTLNGGRGNDTMRGGAGNDTYVIDSTGDVIVENLNEGTDTVQSSISYTLGANLENLTLTGTAAINGTGNSLNNVITGNSGNNTLNGGSGVDTLLGGNGNDILIGGTGNDTLTGGAGSDRFTFNSRSEGTDRITDFRVVDDTIVVSAAGFGGGLVAGAAIAASRFAIGSTATTSSQRFMYDRSTGALFFDQDGTGAIAKIQFATLNTALALTNADIFVAA
ncbi:proprotein convertase P-domain-containing protein [Desmonostoc muscorum LEGE 12446]|uniref:Proprotein convertase P-domain-containing protein n=1 Tax=Desmonostoc muscorum LEGE 12446 TaxID=1828758 RepID=A0A8J7D0H6_DESMC|nr:proprotein convertase P-domain-containing protein [Desmonostoc muscorum]MCF2146476.1 proprotein convertase P-domain-containing protein [Desmonostoc muscorum LEGE 12446]